MTRKFSYGVKNTQRLDFYMVSTSFYVGIIALNMRQNDQYSL